MRKSEYEMMLRPHLIVSWILNPWIAGPTAAGYLYRVSPHSQAQRRNTRCVCGLSVLWRS